MEGRFVTFIDSCISNLLNSNFIVMNVTDMNENVGWLISANKFTILANILLFKMCSLLVM